MSQSDIISQLKSSNLYAECTHCGEEFKLTDAVLFDGHGVFPEIAKEKRKELLEELKQRTELLKKQKISADVGAEKRAIEVGIGKIIEKVIPAYKKFKIPLSDCRPLFEPIDFIVFNGLSEMKIDSVTFLEIKTGNSKLAKHEKMICKAIDEKKLSYKEV
jgi:predicted Holliday junction resolvase-like endonuclease